MKFEWDPEKAQMNLARHEVSFVRATRVFADPYLLERLDIRVNYGEDRWQTIGEVDRDILFVVHTLRSGWIRIISARKTNRIEREAYVRARAEAEPAPELDPRSRREEGESGEGS
ncbi:MAG: BrnT family toxin [Alphaproteobacteria bacterium]